MAFFLNQNVSLNPKIDYVHFDYDATELLLLRIIVHAAHNTVRLLAVVVVAIIIYSSVLLTLSASRPPKTGKVVVLFVRFIFLVDIVLK